MGKNAKKPRARKAKRNNNGGRNQLELSSFRFHQLTLSGKKNHVVRLVSNTNMPVDLGMAVQLPSERAQFSDSEMDTCRWQLPFPFFLHDHYRVTRPSCSSKSNLEPHANIAPLLLGAHVTQDNIAEYIQDTHMDLNGAWGTDVEILTLAHLLQTNITLVTIGGNCLALTTWIIVCQLTAVQSQCTLNIFPSISR